jgi:ubiquinone/menaquinone biosynthesis C-methylase UbiE
LPLHAITAYDPRMRPTGEYRAFPEKPGRNTRQQTLEVPLFVRLLGLARHSLILEIGCGAGIALPVLHRLCAPARLVGLDVDATALAAAAGRTRRLQSVVELVEADVRSMPFRDESFDLVVDFGTCYHIARGEAAALEIERVLKPGGVFASETKLSQFLSHPVRSFGRRLPLPPAGTLRLSCHRGLWLSFEKLK